MNRLIAKAIPAACLAAMFSTLMTSPAHAAVLTFRQGVNGYVGATDLTLYKEVPDNNYAFSASLQVGDPGAYNEKHTLLGFDNLFGNGINQIPLGSTINVANIYVSNTAIAVPATGSVHRMNVGWSDLISTWNSMSGGINNAPLGEYEATPSYAGPLSGYFWDVTSIVQDWSDGTPNFGIAVLPTGGLLGFVSSDSASVNLRPLLTIDFTPVPEPSPLALLSVLGLALVRRRRG
jgi:hypothetical protein